MSIAMPFPRILILDDDDQYAFLFSTYLKLGKVDGGRVTHATSTEMALAQLGEFAPDLIFLDNRIPPHADFRPALRALRQAGYDGPVVVQSACVADDVFDEAKSLGVAEVIDKFDMSEDRLIHLLKKHTRFGASVQG
jgi:CheY-like chemotaxis protein